MKIFKFIPLWRGKYNKKNKGFTHQNFLKKISGGFTLVETLVAISIFTMSILGLLIVLTNGISDTGYAKKKLAASYLAQEGIEYVRNQRDNAVLYDAISPSNGWDNFTNASLASITPSSPSDSSFTRTIQRTLVGTEEVKITSTVTWTQGSGNFNVVFTEELYNWVE